MLQVLLLDFAVYRVFSCDVSQNQTSGAGVQVEWRFSTLHDAHAKYT